VSKEDIHDKLDNPPIRKLITNGDGVYIAVMEISDVLQAPYRRCKTCAARYRCSRAQKEKNEKNFLDVNCIIEEEALDVVLSKLTLDGVTSQDALIRNVFQLIRLYELESVQDLSRILRDEDAMKTYKEINGMINKSEQAVIKFTKELLATPKEDQKKTIKSLGKNKKNFDLAKKLGAKKKNASQNRAINEGKT